MTLDDECKTAIEAVRLATLISRAVQAEITPGRWDKGDRTPVTVADLGVQAVVSGMLGECFPADPLMAEEGAEELCQPAWADLLAQVVSGVHRVHTELPTAATILDWIDRGQRPVDPERRSWILDPVDGTKGFLRKEQYAIALALVERGRILLGVLGCPNLPDSLGDDASKAQAPEDGRIYYAIRGGGAFRVPATSRDNAAPVPVRVSSETDPRLASWCERVEASAGNQDKTSQIVEQAGIIRPPHRIDSQAKYAVVARGEASLYLRHTLDPTYREKVWDHAAGVLLVEEAGGKTTDLFGRPLDFSRGRELSGNRGIVSTSGHFHDRVLAAVNSVLELNSPEAK